MLFQGRPTITVKLVYRYLKRWFRSDNETNAQIIALREYFSAIIQDHRDQFDQADLKDYIDVYLDEINQVEGTDRASNINERNLIATVIHLFAAGSETTVTTLRWAILYMIGYPEIQTKVQQEIDAVVGRERLPNLSDKDKMPYTEATLMEVQRIATIAPLGVPHRASEDTTLCGGYTIPQNALVISNIWAIHHDHDVWKDLDLFRPERFLDGNTFKQQPEEYLPFSVGK